MAIEIGNINADTSVKLGNTTIQSGYIGTNLFFGNQLLGVLDLYPTSVHHAYSLRKLKSSYTGKCLRIRRTTITPTVTTTTVDLSFDSNNTISLNSAITYVSGTATTATNLGQFCASILNGYSNPDLVNTNQNIFVVTWFDQSGNNKNPTQATAGSQPKIVNVGNLETKDSKVAVRFTKASSTNLQIADTTSSTNNLSIYFVGAYVTTVTGNIGYATGLVRIYFPFSNGSNLYAGYGNTSTAILLDSLNTNRKLYEFLAPSPLNSAVAQAWSNGVAKTTTTLLNSVNLSIQLGTGATNYFDGYIQEVIAWQSNANRIEKETNINQYWQVY